MSERIFSILVELVTNYKLLLSYTPPKCLTLPVQETLTEKEKSLHNLVINIIDFCIISGSISPIPPFYINGNGRILWYFPNIPQGDFFFLCETFLVQKSETFYGDAGQENVISE